MFSIQATGWNCEELRFNFTTDKRVLSLVQDPGTPAKPPILCVSVGIFPGVKQQGREADHLPQLVP